MRLFDPEYPPLPWPRPLGYLRKHVIDSVPCAIEGHCGGVHGVTRWLEEPESPRQWHARALWRGYCVGPVRSRWAWLAAAKAMHLVLLYRIHRHFHRRHYIHGTYHSCWFTRFGTI